MDSESQAPARGRPRQFDPEAVSERLFELFWERGYDNVSQQQMAAATGLSTSSLYNAFGTKDAIYRQALERFAGVREAIIAPMIDGSRGIEDLLAAVDGFDAAMDGEMGRNGCLVTMTMNGVIEPDGATAQLVSDHRAELEAAFRAVLTRARDLGEPVPDPAATAPLMVAIMLGILTTARGTDTPEETHRQVDGLRRLVTGWRAAQVQV